MESENCVAFRVDKVGSQEPGLDLYCSKNNLIRDQQHPPYLLTQTPLDWPNKTELSIAIKRLISAKLWLWWWIPIDAFLFDGDACGHGDCTIDGDWWHVESIYGWARGVESILSASHEESGDSQPAAITLILSGPRKLSRDRITTSQPTFNTNPK